MAVWTHEQTTGNAGTDNSPTYASNVKSGSLLIAMVAGSPTTYDAAGNIPTDTLGTTFQFIRKVTNTTDGIMTAWWWGVAPSAGANTVTIAAPTSFQAYLISEFSVNAGTIAIDTGIETGQKFTTPGTGTDAVTSGSVTPSAADALILGYASENAGNANLTEGTNFAPGGGTNLAGFVGNPVKIEYRTLASPASVAGTWTQDSNQSGCALVAAFLATGAAQMLAPSADSADGTWTDNSGGTSLAAQIDETSASDSDYIRSVLGPSNAACRVKLAAGSDPASSSGHIIHWRAGKDITGGATIGLTVKLYQGGGNSQGAGTLIASFTRANVDAFTTYDETLSGAEADAITNYGDLYLEFSANQT